MFPCIFVKFPVDNELHQEGILELPNKTFHRGKTYLSTGEFIL